MSDWVRRYDLETKVERYWVSVERRWELSFYFWGLGGWLGCVNMTRVP